MSALVGVFTYYYNSGSWEEANGIQTSNLRRFNRTIFKDGGNSQEKVKLPGLWVKGRVSRTLRVVEWRELSGGSCVDFTPNL